MASQKDRARLRRRAEKRKRRKEALKPKYPIQLDKHRDEHARAAAAIEKLIDVRKFNPVAIGGILIVEELERGEMSELLSRYSWIIDKIIATHQPPPGGGDLIKGIVDEMQLRGLAVPTEKPMHNDASGQPRPQSSGGLSLGKLGSSKTLKFDVPTDDDDDEIIIKRDTTANVSNSFLDNMIRACEQLAAAPISDGAKIITAPRDFSRRDEDDGDLLVAKRVH